MVEKGLIPLPAIQQTLERQKLEVLQALTFSAPAPLTPAGNAPAQKP
jgi:hypothetical protein